MELDETQTKVKKTVEMVVGKDVSPFVGMRVRHISGKDHRSSRGQLGTIEIIPGRGALKTDERSVSVRWDADKSDVLPPSLPHSLYLSLNAHRSNTTGGVGGRGGQG